MDLTGATIKDHAVAQMGNRRIADADIRGVLVQPEAIMAVHPGRVVAQGMSGGLLLRVFVDVDRQPVEVVTVYRTSQTENYRGKP